MGTWRGHFESDMDSLKMSQRGESNKPYLKGSIPKGNFLRDPMFTNIDGSYFFFFFFF
uniref:Uncharacterized protein n=1 Tax=Glypta fumiferanae TaxID=389681 RepID=A0A0F6QAB4_9HYME|nr:hypothetical protein [Glypta fumiferanae]